MGSYVGGTLRDIILFVAMSDRFYDIEVSDETGYKLHF